ncbi:MAG: PilT/PilU family type 4a pilus ATPase [Lachnospiraceae bacterium]|nr:PilT/PilU family type 4a pilus ATPase [Lachnospiraceae bacterium]
MNFYDLIEYAKSEGCSDVHITVGTALAIRKFGKLQMLEPVPSAEESQAMIFEALTPEQRQKVMSGEDLDFALITSSGRLRANIYHQRNNLAATYRILKSEIPSFDELEIPEAVRNLVNEPRGLVLITGPTGSGKTTTLAAMIDYINKKQAKHVMTIEDPIEYVYYHAKSMIHQREVGKDVSDFATALRSSLREDPDVILVGEMRDFETINAAITAAETGHLVFSTLHTTSAPQTIERIIDAYPPHGQGQARTQLANVLRGVVTQQLISRDDREGMTIATEVLINNDAIANQIRENKTHQILSSIQAGAMQGMHTLNADLKRLVRMGRITNTTALKYCSNVKDYENLR